jgi:ABC-type oligopeptide transport system substrate-binding subunit
MVEQATCAGLLRYVGSAADAALEPEVAAAMPRVSSDGLTYTFEVRPGFRFSEPSGEEVTAETFRYSIERALSPRLEEGGFAPAPLFVDDIEGEQAFRDGEAEHISGLTADGNELSITLAAPSPDFLWRLTLPFFCPVPLDTPLARGAAKQRLSTDAGFVEQVPSAGPYYVADHINGEYIILRRNPNYAGERAATYDTIALREGVNAGVAIQRVQSGEWDGIVHLYDHAFNPRGELASRWGPDSEAAVGGDQRYHGVPDGGIWYVMFNARQGSPFSDVRLRRAVSLALDREALSTIFAPAFSSTVPWSGVLAPPLTSAAPEPASLEQDVEAAQGLVSPAPEAPLRLVFTDGCEECALAADRIVADLADIGLEVMVEAVEDSVQAIHEPGAPHDMKIGASWPDTPDPASFLSRLLIEDMPSEWLPAPLAEAAQELASTEGERRTSAAIALAEGPVSDEVPLAVFGHTLHGAFFAPTLDCLEFPLVGGLDLVALCPGE